jgi:hypothetical protein
MSCIYFEVSRFIHGPCMSGMNMWFCGYFTLLSVSRTIYCLMIGWLVNSELERIWKETVID